MLQSDVERGRGALGRRGWYLAAMTVLTGTVDTIAVKLASLTVSAGPDGRLTGFDHPLFVSLLMFCGMAGVLLVPLLRRRCWAPHTGAALGDCEAEDAQFLRDVDVVFDSTAAAVTLKGSDDAAATPVPPLSGGSRRGRRSPLLWLAFPSLCDTVGTTLSNTGLMLCSASVYQMLRGTVLLWTALVTYAVFRRLPSRREVVGIALVVVGCVAVGVSASFQPATDTARNPTLGTTLIAISGALVGIQVVFEEYYVRKHQVDTFVMVGSEGCFGVLWTTVGSFVLFYSTGPNGERAENVPAAAAQLYNSWPLLCTFAVFLLSVAGHMVYGIAMSRELSSTTRMIFDGVRIVVVWVVSLACGWEGFDGVQLGGFMLMLAGTGAYSGLLRCPLDYAVAVPKLTSSVSGSSGRIDSTIALTTTRLARSDAVGLLAHADAT